jgi:hypothetical protein
MAGQQDYERNNAAYRRLKDKIAQTYPKGWFVGIADEKVVGAAATFGELKTLLREQGRDPREVLVVEAGVDYPEHVTLFLERHGSWKKRPGRPLPPCAAGEAVRRLEEGAGQQLPVFLRPLPPCAAGEAVHRLDGIRRMK